MTYGTLPAWANGLLELDVVAIKKMSFPEAIGFSLWAWVEAMHTFRMIEAYSIYISTIICFFPNTKCTACHCGCICSVFCMSVAKRYIFNKLDFKCRWTVFPLSNEPWRCIKLKWCVTFTCWWYNPAFYPNKPIKLLLDLLSFSWNLGQI